MSVTKTKDILSLLLQKANENSLYTWMVRYADSEAGSVKDDVAEDWSCVLLVVENAMELVTNET